MAGDNSLLLIGGLAVVGLVAWKSGLLNNLGLGGATPVSNQDLAIPVQQVTGNFPEQQVASTPGIGVLVISPEIIAAPRADILLALPHCDLDDIRDRDDDDGHDADASIKIWEQEHNQLFHTVKERNEHSLKRCDIIHFYRSINFRLDFDDPIRQHICLNKRVIIDEDRKGLRDSPRANSAALDVAHITTPIIQSCTKCTINVTNVAPTTVVNSPGAIVNKNPLPGANRPPIPTLHTPPPAPHNPSGSSTTPTTPQVGAPPHIQAAYARAYAGSYYR